MSFLKSLFQNKRDKSTTRQLLPDVPSRSLSEAEAQADPELLQLIENPRLLADPTFPADSYLEVLGNALFSAFLLNAEKPELIEKVIVELKEKYRIRLGVGNITLWLYDFDLKDEFGLVSGKEEFLLVAKLPRTFLPDIVASSSIRSLREHIIGRNVAQITVSKEVMGGGRFERCDLKTIGYYFGRLELPNR